jgi:hypothetical protein
MPAIHSKPAGPGGMATANKRYVQPVIGLERPSKKELKKDECLTFKLRSSPNDANSLTYEITVPFFRNGSPEELLLFLKLVDRVLAGTNTTSGPNKYALIRRLLQGDALTAFNNAATAEGNETNANYEICCQKLIKHAFPKKALTDQKRYMRRFLRKPRDMKTRIFMGRLIELNDYLELFPDFQDNQKLAQDEIMDIAEYGVPNTWQKTMVLQGFNPVDNTPAAFIEFCERLEFAEGSNSNQEMKSQSDSKNAKKGGPLHAKTPERGNKKRKNNETEPEYYCRLHGPNTSHNTAECKNLKSQADKMRAAYMTLPNANKRFKYQNKTWNREEKNKTREQLMFEAMKQAAKEAFTAERIKNKKDKKDPPAYDELDLDHFEELQISDEEHEE